MISCVQRQSRGIIRDLFSFSAASLPTSRRFFHKNSAQQFRLSSKKQTRDAQRTMVASQRRLSAGSKAFRCIARLCNTRAGVLLSTIFAGESFSCSTEHRSFLKGTLLSVPWAAAGSIGKGSCSSHQNRAVLFPSTPYGGSWQHTDLIRFTDAPERVSFIPDASPC